jgi:2-phospho-L-lactate/phosphoenolpyruvate guanylyltransferase
MTLALVPVRSPGSGKTRLSTGLDVDERAALAGAMLADVVAVLTGTPAVDDVVVVAAGAPAAAVAAALGVDAILDPPGAHGIDRALAAASARLPAAAATLVVAADLPRLTTADVTTLLSTSAPVAVAPTADGGTGGLLRRPAEVIATAYGPGSAQAHVDAARRAGIDAPVLDLPGFRDDIDTWDDLRRLRYGWVGPRTAAVVAALGDRIERAV